MGAFTPGKSTHKNRLSHSGHPLAMGHAVTKLLGVLRLQATQSNSVAASVLLMSRAELAGRLSKTSLAAATALGTNAMRGYTIAGAASIAVEKLKSAWAAISAKATALAATAYSGATGALQLFTLANLRSTAVSAATSVALTIQTAFAKGLAGAYLLATGGISAFSAVSLSWGGLRQRPPELWR